jgi:hypothetical protein
LHLLGLYNPLHLPSKYNRLFNNTVGRQIFLLTLKALIFSISLVIGVASARELRISFEPPQNVAAIQFACRELNSPRLGVYGTFLFSKHGDLIKARECLHVKYTNDIPTEVSRSAVEVGKTSMIDVETVFRFAETLKNVRQIDIVCGENGAVWYVFSKDQVLRVGFMGNQQPNLEKLNEHEAPVMRPRMILVVPKGGQAPIFKKSDAQSGPRE